MVEKVLVGSDSLGLDGFKEVLSVMGEGAHQVVLLITVKEQSEPEQNPSEIECLHGDVINVIKMKLHFTQLHPQSSGLWTVVCR